MKNNYLLRNGEVAYRSKLYEEMNHVPTMAYRAKPSGAKFKLMLWWVTVLKDWRLGMHALKQENYLIKVRNALSIRPLHRILSQKTIADKL